MEVAERFAHRTDQFIAFGMHRAADSEIYCAASRTKGHILELIYNHHCEERIYMEQSTLADLSKFMPSHGIPKDAPSIFNKSNKQQQDRLLVDYHLLTEELKVSSERVALIQTKWSPLQRSMPGKYYLAYLTNFGGCEIRQKHTGRLSWCIVVHNVAKEWMIHRQKSIKYVLTSFETLEEAVYSIKITAITWNNLCGADDNVDFCFITANGNVAFYAVGDSLQLQFEKQLDLKLANAIEWFTIDDTHRIRRSYIIASSMNGTISLYNVRYDQADIVDVLEIVQLFAESDGVCANGIHWDFLEQSNQLIFIVCKGMHVFAYLFSIDDQMVLSSCNHYVGHLSITGITRKNPLEYIVATLSGHMENVHINIHNNAVAIASDEMKQPNGHSKYALYGVATSLNNAFLLGSYFAGRPYDHLRLREPGHIAVSHLLGGVNSLEMLLHNRTCNLSQRQDLAESIRSTQLRNDKIFKSYLDVYPPEIACTEEYVYILKVRIILTSARSIYLRLKNRLIESGNLYGEYNVLKKFIAAIQSYAILKRLHQNANDLDEFQIISGQCHRTVLNEFINLSIFDEYEAIKEQFNRQIEDLLTSTDEFDTRAVERCAYCECAVDRVKGICDQNHDIPRCCITMTQIPIMNQRQCRHCQLFALDDVDKLKRIVPTIDSDEPICQLCDTPMHLPHATFFDYPD